MKAKKCPFCGAKRSLLTSHDGYYSQDCLECGTQGPHTNIELEALKLWNRRIRVEKTMTSLAKKACQLAQLRARLEETDEQGCGICCSCGRGGFSWEQLQGGHYEPKGRTYNDAATDGRNVHAQCSSCNRDGKTSGYTLFMIKKYGQGIIEELFLLSKKTTHERNYYTCFIKASREVCRGLAKTKTFHVNIP